MLDTYSIDSTRPYPIMCLLRLTGVDVTGIWARSTLGLGGPARVRAKKRNACSLPLSVGSWYGTVRCSIASHRTASHRFGAEARVLITCPAEG